MESKNYRVEFHNKNIVAFNEEGINYKKKDKEKGREKVHKYKQKNYSYILKQNRKKLHEKN